MSDFLERLEGFDFDGPDPVDGEVVTDAIVVIRTQRADGPGSHVVVHTTADMDWLIQLGMAEVLRDICQEAVEE